MSIPSKKLLLLLGGSFNPPHAGHFRIAVETSELLGGAETLFIPCANPPHKRSDNLMPFELRCAMLRAGIGQMRSLSWPSSIGGRLSVCEIENEREGSSYTVDTLSILAERHADKRLVFILGSADYANLASWRRWRELPDKADLVVLPRSACDPEMFSRTTRQLWPEAVPTEAPFPAVDEAFALPGGGRLFHLPQPLLEVSSSLVRERLLSGRCLDFLVPGPVLRLLKEASRDVVPLWAKALDDWENAE